MDIEFDSQYYGQLFCGVDEAGRGPLAGPVYAAAVILPEGLIIEGLNDSKKISAKKRDVLFDLICESAVSYGIAFATAQEIEEHNILAATHIAMNRAIEILNPVPEIALIDGNMAGGIRFPHECVIKGDSKSMAIAAASILAKVSRDRVMVDIGKRYPQYLFEVHKGYGTKKHYEALDEYGYCPEHRISFLKKYYEKKERKH